MRWRFLTLLGAGLATATMAATQVDNGFVSAALDSEAYTHPAPVLSYKEREQFLLGRSHFKRRWIAPITFNGEWGLGPTFIQTRCSECHINNGRGGPPASSKEQLSTMLVRLSLPGTDEHGGPKPDPNYGDQFQNNALQAQEVDLRYANELVPAEAELYLDWEEQTVILPDGEKVALRKPKLRVEKLAFGPLGEGAMLSVRNTQPVFGLGLLEAVPETTLQALADEQKKMGLNGRINYVWDFVNNKMAVGRFGWKAGQATLMGQTAAAFLGDLGVTSRFLRVNNCPPIQKACLVQDPANDPEIIDTDMDDFELWLRGMAVPARRNMDDPQVQLGERLFHQVQCGTCHTPVLKTADKYPAFPKLANRVFQPYTDLLLHDMGEELADGRPEFKATGRDWRTQPLWGIGLNKAVNGQTALLHDARARTVQEAILWHGGESAASRAAYSALRKAEREMLVRYVESI
ncbi:MAG: thiol oxidoreductase [Betaproteobacteria bacterium]|nr:thiol oxidoreductase [Betaproteobacteria bacterium]